ncbi:MAG TPA: putative lipid II flippase FtsW [Gaiellales bacterium]|nr:putative lipid II flippase FtsW [Gaiellales bacterium]
MVADVQRVRRRAARSSPQLEYHLLLLVTLGLVAFGLIMVYSASSGTAVVEGHDPAGTLAKQAVYAAVGVAAMLFLARFSYRRLRYFAAPILFATIALLIAVKVPGIGVSIKGAQRWIYVGPISLQPSEFAKAAVLIFVSAVLASRKRPPRTVVQLFNPVGAVVLVVLLLIHSEPDLGTSIAIALMVCGILLVAGTPLRLFTSVALVGAVGVAYTVAREPYQMDRIRTFLDPWKDPAGAGYQSIQALYALGSGGITGVGIGNGTQKIGFLPEAPTDMIGAVIGEELGLIGILGVTLAFAVFTYCGFRIAMRCRDPFGTYLVAGATTLVAGQAIVNFGAVLGFLPLTGVPLPLISSGGSSLVVMLSLVGVMLNVADSRAAAGASAKPRTESRDGTATESRPKPKPARADRRGGNGGARRAGAGRGRRATG